MARVKSYRVHPEFHVPDKDIREFITRCEQDLGPVRVNTIYVPGNERNDPKITVIITAAESQEEKSRYDKAVLACMSGE